MSTVPKHLVTPEEYLAIERAADFKSQYFRGEMFAMAGASKAHNRINDNLVRVLGNQLLGGPCETYSRDLRLKVSPTGLYTYPDLVIVCEKAEFEDEEADTLLNPRVIFEILSESTESYDRGKKFENYQTLPSVEEYVLVSQDQPRIDLYTRNGKQWLLSVFSGLEDTFALSCIPVRISLTEIFRAVEFS